MSEKLIPILVPLLNPNEKEALLVALEVAEGDAIRLWLRPFINAQ